MISKPLRPQLTFGGTTAPARFESTSAIPAGSAPTMSAKRFTFSVSFCSVCRLYQRIKALRIVLGDDGAL